MKNPFGKTAKHAAPYATFEFQGWTWRVLKTYQRPDKEKANQHARWFLAVSSPHVDLEYGDTYIQDVMSIGARLTQATDAWREAYPNH
jgi:hypothetical protein